MFRFLFKPDSILLVDTLDSNAELIDAFCFFEYLKRKNVRAKYIMSIKHKDYAYINKRYPKDIIGVENQFWLMLRVLFELPRTRYVLDSYICLPALLQFICNKSRNIDYVFLQHGMTCFKDVFDKYNGECFNKIVISNDSEAELFLRYGKCRPEQFIKSCMVRFDRLCNSQRNDSIKEIFVFFTFRYSFAKQNTPIENYDFYKNIMLLLDLLQKVAEEKNITVSVGLHYLIKQELLVQIANKNWNRIKLTESTEISQKIKTADMLITDYSSISFDFMFQNKPVLFYYPDFDDNSLRDFDKKLQNYALKQQKEFFEVYFDLKELSHRINAALDCSEKPDYDSWFYRKDNCCEFLWNSLKSGMSS